MKRLKRLGIDAYMLLLLATVLAGIILPAQGASADVLGHVTYWAVSLLFFLYGAKLDPRGVRDGFLNWRLQGLTFGATFVIFPIFGLIIAAVVAPVLGATLALGLLFLAVLPSTVQSSIAFTSIAQGNVAGAIYAASVSNLVGVFLTPALVALLLHADGGGVRIEAIVKIGVQILLPFVVGQVLRPFVGRLVQRHKVITQVVDRGSILLIVYAAFSASTVAGLWADIPLATLVILLFVIVIFLAVVMGAMVLIGKISKMSYPDRTALFYCGATKSLASGLPIATALFASDQVGAIVLPLMMYHMLQLLVSAYLSQKAL
ncbi:bile acid:sodium symporter family protein [Roseobacter sp. GAI101]|uniref:bile acid:sodium symporter family protein n=1 Tax=Roseobacter sp. (strain GAI101) TaxID=391589 RepID=UPI0001871E6E|nr:bile acid:sodium symporter family protein [Roseobacter sp. GAI101]EEB83628.1 bile acid:sodium symporter [Roseobacter sp. GAI101]